MPIKNQNNIQDQIDQEVDKALAQNEDWEESYGHFFREKKKDKARLYGGGTLAAQNEKIKTNKSYRRRGEKPKVAIKIKE